MSAATVLNLADYRKPAPVSAPTDLPHAAEVEAAMLDALVNVPVPMAERRNAVAYLTVDHFHVEANRLVFPAVAAMVAEDIPVDAAAVAVRLRDKTPPDVPGGWLGYLRDVLCDQGGLTVEVRREHAKILDNLRRCREVMRQCAAISARAAAGESATPLIEEACSALAGVSLTRTGTARLLADIGADVFKRISSPERRPRTGYRKLDRAIGRLFGGQVTVIAARPKAGKTNLAWHLAENIVTALPVTEDGPSEAVFFVSAEMSAESLYFRQLGIRARIHPDLLQEGQLKEHHWSSLIELTKGWNNLPIVLDDFGAAAPSVAKIEATFVRNRDLLAAGAMCNSFGHKYPRSAMRVMVIDHLGKIASPLANDSRAGDPQRLKASMEAVCAMAKRHDCHVILLWHAGMRDGDPGADLTMKDIRGTSDVEGSCDRILFLTRPEGDRLKIAHAVDRHRSAAGYEDPIWLETEAGAIWEAADA